VTAEKERTWCVVVAHHARGAGTARHRLSSYLSGLINPELLRDALSVVGELVGNAVQHADPLPGGVIRIAFRMVSDLDGVQALQVRVTDGGAQDPPQPRAATSEATSGRGLAIVAALASRWGVERDGLGQSVWAELPARQLAAV
jgi:anti-sigma regulatory factor (Ser/Thr protein kinase)